MVSSAPNEGSESSAELKFAPSPQHTLSVADKTNTLSATVRYDDEKDITTGDTIQLVSAKTGEVLGTATVEHSDEVPVRQALTVVEAHEAKYGIQDSDTLRKKLNEYYSARIQTETRVKVLILAPTIRESYHQEHHHTDD